MRIKKAMINFAEGCLSMSVFSEKLNSFITNANIKITDLSRLSGVERTYTQKMITGERTPTDRAVLDQLSDALMLTPIERRVLNEAYEVHKMGEATYYRRVMVKRMIEDSESCCNQQLLPPPSPTRPVQHPEVSAVQGKSSVHDTLQLFLAEELSLENPHLMAVLQPESSAAVFLQPYCRMKQELHLEHIIRFDNELQYQKENKYNLQCMRALLPFLLSPCNYFGWFYYDSVVSQMSCHTVFPWFILGEKAVICLSQDGEKAVLLTNKEAIALYQRIFDEIREECRPLLAIQNSKIYQFWDYNRWETARPEMSYSLQYEPCWGFFYTMDMVEKQLHTHLPNRNQILLFFNGRQKQISLLDGTRKNTSFFTAEGMENFLRTGRISELPEDLYDPLPRAFRIELLRRMIHCAQKGHYIPYLIRSKRFRLPKTLNFFISDEQHLSCSCLHPYHGLISVVMHEKSLVYSICDFLEYLQETGLVYTREETNAYLQQKLKELYES